MSSPAQENYTAAEVTAPEVPTLTSSSSAVLTPPLSKEEVGPTAAAVATAPSPASDDDVVATLQHEGRAEDKVPAEGAAAPHAAAAATTSSKRGIAGGDTAAAAAAASKQSSSSPSPRSRRSTTNYHQDYSSEGIIIPSNEEEKATAPPAGDGAIFSAGAAAPSPRYPTRDRSSSDSGDSIGIDVLAAAAAAEEEETALLRHDNDIVLSMKDANYKSIMFSFFQKLGAKTSSNRDVEEEKKVKDEAYAFFKNTGGRLLSYINYRRVEDGVVEVDEKTARDSKLLLVVVAHTVYTFYLLPTLHVIYIYYTLFYCCVTEIARDITARMESKHRWSNGQDFSNDIPSLQHEEAAVDEEVESEDESLSSDDEDGSDYEDESSSLLPVLPKGKDVILSMRDANYKAIMFSFFQRLGAKHSDERDRDEEKMAKEEAYALFKNTGGRLMIYRTKSVNDGLKKADEKTARFSKL